ncbi:MAG: hypothetical protein R3C28_19065 [Pirellulaceae bacterium]
MTSPRHTELADNVRSVLDRLKGRIRWYVWLEGLSWMVVCLGAVYWLGLALDYLPVLAGSTEMPRAARATILLMTLAAVAFIAYRWILRRAFVRFTNRNMATLIERKFPEFGDSLLTTVEFAEAAPEDRPAMLDRTREDAIAKIQQIDVNQVFDLRPLMRAILLAGVLGLSIVVFGAANLDAFRHWTSRLLLLTDQEWPRKAAIELLDFSQSLRKVAEGTDVTLRVRADADRTIPRLCTIYFRTENGERGRVNMSKDGEPVDGFQYYRFSGTPFQGMLESVAFDVVGYDHRLNDFQIEVVPSPSIVDIQLRAEFPEYTGRLPRTDPWSLGTRVPIGSRIRLVGKCNKPLSQVLIAPQMVDGADEEAIVEPILLQPDKADATSFTAEIDSLEESLNWAVTLTDQDGITSEQPFRLVIGAVADSPPNLDITLKGIGTAITPQVRLPIQGKVEDDYGIKSAWFNVAVQDKPDVLRHPFAVPGTGQIDTELDVRKQSQADSQFLLNPGEMVELTIQAEDGFNLQDANQGNIGISEAFPLEVVEPDALLALLEAKELGLRRRFEQVIAEMTETRDSLARVKQEASNSVDSSANSSDESDDASSEDSAANQDQDRLDSLRLLRVQRARLQGDKSMQEVLGVAVSFENIREELINNRIDTEERKIRLQDQIAAPLRQIAEQQFPAWDDYLATLETLVQGKQAAADEAEQAVRLTDELILAMEEILSRMEELESYNELVALVRSILEEQTELLEETQEERKRQVQSLFD